MLTHTKMSIQCVRERSGDVNTVLPWQAPFPRGLTPLPADNNSGNGPTSQGQISGEEYPGGTVIDLKPKEESNLSKGSAITSLSCSPSLQGTHGPVSEETALDFCGTAAG